MAIRGCNLLANNLAYILISLFNKDMGLKFAGSKGDFPGLGIATMRASRVSLRK